MTDEILFEKDKDSMITMTEAVAIGEWVQKLGEVPGRGPLAKRRSRMGRHRDFMPAWTYLTEDYEDCENVAFAIFFHYLGRGKSVVTYSESICLEASYAKSDPADRRELLKLMLSRRLARSPTAERFIRNLLAHLVSVKLKGAGV